jgi:small subunit ribosomal protein S20
MAHHKSAIKKIRQDVIRTDRNKASRTRVRNVIKEVRQAIEDGNVETAQEAYKKMVPIIDSMVSKNIMHKNSVARTKSRLNAQIKALTQVKA